MCLFPNSVDTAAELVKVKARKQTTHYVVTCGFVDRRGTEILVLRGIILCGGRLLDAGWFLRLLDFGIVGMIGWRGSGACRVRVLVSRVRE